MADDGDTFDGASIDGLSDVLPAALLPSTVGELKDLAERLVFGDLPEGDDADDLGRLIGERLQPMSPAARAEALQQPVNPGGNSKRNRLLRAGMNPVTADEYNGMSVPDRKQRLVFVGSVAANVHTMRQAWSRLYGLSFDGAGKAISADDDDGEGDFAPPAAVAALVTTIEAHMGSGMAASRKDLEAFIALVAPGILPDAADLSDEHLVICAHRCLDCLPSRQLAEVVAGADDWRAAIAGVDEDDVLEVAFAAPASDIAVCFGKAANSLEGLASIAAALGLPRSSGKAMLKGIDEQVAGWSVSTVEALRDTRARRRRRSQRSPAPPAPPLAVRWPPRSPPPLRA